jgi:hypothetical protein
MISFYILSLVASILLCIEAGITFLALKYAEDMYAIQKLISVFVWILIN